MKDFEKAIWFDDNVSRAQVLVMDNGELLICFTDRHAVNAISQCSRLMPNCLRQTS